MKELIVLHRFPGITKRHVQIKKNENYNVDIRLDSDITRGSQWLKSSPLEKGACA